MISGLKEPTEFGVIKNENRICLGMAMFENAKTKTVGTLIQLFKANPDMGFIIEQGPYVFANREVVAARFMNDQRNFTHLFFVDADMVFTSDVLDKLVAHDKDIVGARYFKRQGKEKEPVIKTRYDMPGVQMPDHIFKNYAVATGCLLIKREVFEKIPRPWFSMGTPERQEGEDIYFSRRARECGIEIWIDPMENQIKHIGEYEY